MIQGGALHEEIKVVQAYPPASQATTGVQYNGAAGGAGIDTKGFEDALVAINAGAMGADTVTFELLTNSIDTTTGATAVTDGTNNAIKAVVNADDNKTYLLRYKCNERGRYLFVKTTPAGANANVYQVSVILGKAKTAPVTQSQTVAFEDKL